MTAVNNINAEWDTSLPYESIPGPSKYALVRGFSPGGSFHTLSQAINVAIKINIYFHDPIRKIS